MEKIYKARETSSKVLRCLEGLDPVERMMALAMALEATVEAIDVMYRFDRKSGEEMADSLKALFDRAFERDGDARW